MSVSNIIEVAFGSATLVFTPPYYKYNSGMYYQFTDLDLPESYQVHFSNSPSGTSIESVGTSDGVLIPDDVWQSGATIYAWIYLHPTDDSGITKYEVRTPVSGRADMPDDIEPTQSEQTTIDTLVTALNTAVADAEQAKEDAEASAEASATNVTHYPIITGGYWYVWDAENSEYVNTEVKAEGENGEDGVGISSIEKTGTVDLVDTYTVTFSDGTTFDYTVTNGQDGDTGATPSFSIGTVTTLESGESATASITGTDENPVLNLGIPKGADGDDYVLTDTDKAEIADLVETDIEPTLLSAFPTDTASGSVASFTDGANLPLKSLVVGIEPSQDTSDGDPSPTNICPISGWTGMTGKAIGANILNLVESDMISNGWNRSFPISIKAGTYIISCQNQFGVGTTYGVGVKLVDASDNVIASLTSSYTFGNSALVGNATTITEAQADSITHIRFDPRAKNMAFSDFESGLIQLEVGSSATDYEAYTVNKDISISFGQTVYGGSLDVLTGVLTVTHAIVDMGTLYWRYASERAYFYAALSTRKKASSFLCSGYAYGGNAYDSQMTSADDDTVYGDTTGSTIKVKDTTYTDATAFTSAVSGIMICYQLATTTTIQLTAQEVSSLLGDNNIYADCGDTTVEYRADPTLYVNKKITEAISALS